MRHLVLIFLCLLTLSSASADEGIARQHFDRDFAETREVLLQAIENRGLVISYVSHIGDMLKRTGKDLGSERLIYDQAEIIEFCSARQSREMMEADPHNIVFCPFAIAVYSLPDQAGSWLAYRRGSGSATAIVNGLLKEILANCDD